MKLARIQKQNSNHLAVVRDNGIITLDGLQETFPTMHSIISGGEAALSQIRQFIADKPNTDSLENVSLLAPITRPGKILAIGMNYKKHEEEAVKLGIERRSQQTWFNKQITCISGPFDDIDPGVTEKLDYEAELALVIGTNAKYLTRDNALDAIFGYMVINDVSARDWQAHTPTFTMGKSFDTHGPTGPWIVTKDELPDPQNLQLHCYVNGERRQQTNTSEMVHTIVDQLVYLTQAFSLEPGDIIATGTPEGVGIAMEPPVFLQPGDVVRCEIEGIGAIENTVVPPLSR